MIKTSICGLLIAPILMLSTCIAQDTPPLKKLESELVNAAERLKQEKIDLDKRLDDKTLNEVVSAESFDSAVEQIFVVRAKIEKALGSHGSDPSVFKGSSLEGASPEHIKATLKNFTKQTWDYRLKFADYFRQNGKYDNAIEQLETTINEIETAHGIDHPLSTNFTAKLKTAQWLDAASESQLTLFRKNEADRKEASQLFATKNFQGSAEKLNTVLQDLESLGFTDSLAYCESLANIAEAYLNLKEFAKAQEMFERAIKSNDAFFKKKNRVNANLRRSYSNNFKEQKQFDRAVAMLDEAEVIYQSISPEATLDRAVAIYMKGQIIQSLKDYEEATRDYYQAVEILVAAKENRLFGALEKSISECFEAMNDVDGPPSAVADKALEIGMRVFGNTNHLKTTDWLMTIAKIKRGQKKLDDCVAIFEKTATVFENVPNYQSQPNYLGCVMELERIHSSNKAWGKAAKYAEQSAQSASKILGSNDLAYGRALVNAGNMYSNNSEYDKAEELYAAGLKIVSPEMHPQKLPKGEHINTQVVRAINLKRAKRWKDAIPVWKKLEELTAADGSVHKTVRVAIVEGLIESYRSTDQPELADHYSEQLSE